MTERREREAEYGPGERAPEGERDRLPEEGAVPGEDGAVPGAIAGTSLLGRPAGRWAPIRARRSRSRSKSRRVVAEA